MCVSSLFLIVFRSSIDVSHLSHLDLVSTLDDPRQPRVILFQANNSLAKTSDFLAPVFIVRLERGVVDDACLLFDLEMLLLEHLAVVLHLGQRDLLVVQLLIQRLQLSIVQQVLLLHVLQLLTRVRQYNHRVRYLLTQLVQLFVSLFNLFIECLIFDL